jgi:hypothetical protein
LFIAGVGQAFSHMDSGPDNSGSGLMWAGLAVGGVSWVGSVIDAPLSARTINHRRGYSALKAPGVGLVFVPNPRNTRRLQRGVGLRAGF